MIWGFWRFWISRFLQAHLGISRYSRIENLRSWDQLSERERGLDLISECSKIFVCVRSKLLSSFWTLSGLCFLYHRISRFEDFRSLKILDFMETHEKNMKISRLKSWYQDISDFSTIFDAIHSHQECICISTSTLPT